MRPLVNKTLMNVKVNIGKKHSSFLRGFSRWMVLGVLVLVLGSFVGNAQIVPVYADQVTIQSHVVNEGNAVDVDTTNFATLESNTGLNVLGVVVGDYTGELELQFPSTLSAGTTSYVKIDFDGDVLNSLLGGELGGTLADLVGSLALGDHFFNVEARMNGTTVLAGSSKDEFKTDNLRLIINTNGDYLLAITPDQNYNKIYIKDVTNAALLGLGISNSMNVYYAYYITGQDSCEEMGFATSFNGSGGTVDALGFGNAGVTNPENAIDGDPATFSELSQGLLTLAGSISQTVYFQSLSDSTDQYHLTIRTDDSTLLNLGLFDGVKIQAFDGMTMVSEKALSTLLDLDLLGLLSTGNVGTVSFSPGVPFDRIRVTISSLVELNLVKNLEIYEVYRSVAIPNVLNMPSEGPMSFCEDETIVLSIENPLTDIVYKWYDQPNGTPIATSPSYDPGNLPVGSHTFYVSATKDYCTEESAKTKIELKIKPLLRHPDITVDMVID